MKMKKYKVNKYADYYTISDDPKEVAKFWTDSTHPVYKLENTKWKVVVKGVKNEDSVN